METSLEKIFFNKDVKSPEPFPKLYSLTSTNYKDYSQSIKFDLDYILFNNSKMDITNILYYLKYLCIGLFKLKTTRPDIFNIVMIELHTSKIIISDVYELLYFLLSIIISRIESKFKNLICFIIKNIYLTPELELLSGFIEKYKLYKNVDKCILSGYTFIYTKGTDYSLTAENQKIEEQNLVKNSIFDKCRQLFRYELLKEISQPDITPSLPTISHNQQYEPSAKLIYVSIGEYKNIGLILTPLIFIRTKRDPAPTIDKYKEMLISDVELKLFNTGESDYSDFKYMILIGEYCIKENPSECNESFFLDFINFINYTILGIFKLALYNREIFRQLLMSKQWGLHDKFNHIKSSLYTSTTNKKFLDNLLILIYLYIYHNIDNRLKTIIIWILHSIFMKSGLSEKLDYNELIGTLLTTSDFGFTTILCDINGKKIDEIAIPNHIDKQYTYLLEEMDNIGTYNTSSGPVSGGPVSSGPSSGPVSGGPVSGAAEEPSGAAEEPTKTDKQKFKKHDCPSEKINITEIKKDWCKQNTDGSYGPNLWGKHAIALHPDKNRNCRDQKKVTDKWQQGNNYCQCLNKKDSSRSIKNHENYCFSTIISNPSGLDSSGFGSEFDPFGYDPFEFGSSGFSSSGFDPPGFGSSGFDPSGYDSSGHRSDDYRSDEYRPNGYKQSEFDPNGDYKPANDIYIPDIDTPGRYLANNEIKHLLYINNLSELSRMLAESPNFSIIKPTKKQIIDKLNTYIIYYESIDNLNAVMALLNIIDKYTKSEYTNKYLKYKQKYMELKTNYR